MGTFGNGPLRLRGSHQWSPGGGAAPCHARGASDWGPGIIVIAWSSPGNQGVGYGAWDAMESRWVGEIPVGLRRSQGTRDCAGMAGSMTSTMLLSTSGEKVLGTFLEGPSNVGMGLLTSHSSKQGKRKQRSLAKSGQRGVR